MLTQAAIFGVILLLLYFIYSASCHFKILFKLYDNRVSSKEEVNLSIDTYNQKALELNSAYLKLRELEGRVVQEKLDLIKENLSLMNQKGGEDLLKDAFEKLTPPENDEIEKMGGEYEFPYKPRMYNPESSHGDSSPKLPFFDQ